MQLSIDPDTGNMIGADTKHLYTWDEVIRMGPPCPRCGTPVSIRPMDSDGKELRSDRKYYVGRHDFNCRCYMPEVV